MAIDRSEVESSPLADLKNAIEERNAERLRDMIGDLPAQDAVELLDGLRPSELASAATLLGDEGLAELLEDAEPAWAARLILKLSYAQAADVLEEMDPDDATDIVEEMKPAQAEAILTAMEPEEAGDIRDLLAYPPNTAGGRMTPEFVGVSPDLTVDQALTVLRRVAAETETIYYVYVIDAEDRLLGVLNLRQLVLAPPGTPITEMMIRDPVKVRADADQEVAARLLTENAFQAIPVVDEEDKLVGIITADDAADVLEEEVSEDIERLGGSEALDRPYLHSSVLDLLKKRVRWLLLLFVAQAYTSAVLSHFQGELQQMVALTFFIPLLIGTGGNTGTQITTTLTRALALGEVEPRDALHVLAKEWGVALLLGILMALATIIRAWTMGMGPEVATVVAITAACIVLWSATVAAVLPLALRLMRLDPAVVSGPLITTVVDGTGLIIYFEIARRILGL